MCRQKSGSVRNKYESRCKRIRIASETNLNLDVLESGSRQKQIWIPSYSNPENARIKSEFRRIRIFISSDRYPYHNKYNSCSIGPDPDKKDPNLKPRVKTKEYILVKERRAPPCVFQTFAHPTSPRLSPCPQSRHGSLRLGKKVCCLAGLIQILVNVSKND